MHLHGGIYFYKNIMGTLVTPKPPHLNTNTMHLNHTKIPPSVVHLRNLNLLDNGIYSMIIKSTLWLLQSYESAEWKSHGHNPPHHCQHECQGVAFPQVGNQDVGSGRKDTSTHTGYHCDNKGHHAKTCPNFLAMYEASWGYTHQHKQEYWHARLCWRGWKCHHIWWQEHFKGTKEHSWQLHWRRCLLKVTREQNERLMCDQNYSYLESMPLSISFALEHLNPWHTRGVCLQQNCNAGSRLRQRKGFWMMLQFWENSDCIANLLLLIELKRMDGG